MTCLHGSEFNFTASRRFNRFESDPNSLADGVVSETNGEDSEINTYGRSLFIK